MKSKKSKQDLSKGSAASANSRMSVKNSKKEFAKIPYGKIIILIFLLTGLIFYAFKPALENKFVNWDDQVYVEEQPLVLNKEFGKLWTTPVSLNYHPITMMSLAAQVPDDLKELSPAPFIKANIILHILNTLLVFSLIWLLSKRKLAVSIITAGIFALHPMHVESVVWISERKDVLYTFFFLLSCITYWKYQNDGKYRWLGITFLFFLLSILSKAMGVVLPVVYLLMDYWNNRGLTEKKLFLEKIPFFLISLFFGLMAVNVQSGGDFHGLLTLVGEKVKAVSDINTFSVWQRFQFASFGFVEYILKFFNPSAICTLYPYPEADKLSSVVFIIYPIIFLLTILLIAWAFKKNKLVAFGLGFYLVTVALVLQFLSVGIAIMADRYTYIPYIGLAFMIVFGLDNWLQQKFSKYRIVLYSLSLFFILFLTIRTRSQVGVWKDSDSLWTQVLKYYPTQDEALSYRGNFRGKNGNIEGAMKDFETALQDGCKRADVYEGLGNCYGVMSEKKPNEKQQFVAKAIDMYQKGILLAPDRGNLYFNLGVAQIQTDAAASVNAFNKALQLMPYNENKILPPLGLAYLNAWQYSDAVNVLTKAISVSVATDMLYYHRGLSYLGVGNKEQAINDFNQSLKLNPENRDARAKLEAIPN